MIAALLLLAQVTPVPAEPVPLETTIPAVHANPKKFGGQLVAPARLRELVRDCDLHC